MYSVTDNQSEWFKLSFLTVAVFQSHVMKNRFWKFLEVTVS